MADTSTLFLLSLLWVPGISNYCPYQECLCTSSQIVCMARHLTDIPRLTGPNETGYPYLFLDTNQITTVPAGILPLDLKEISLLNNPIEIVDDNAFLGLEFNLETLIFSSANFTRIPDAFLHLNSLKYFSLSDTAISDWNKDAVENICQTLETLILEKVGLTTWPNWIQNCTNLRDLRIIDSDISFIPDGSFDLLTSNLTSLSIVNSKLTSIPKALSTLQSLRSLTLKTSNISDLTWLPKLSNLSYINLENNNLSDSNHVSYSLLPFFDTLSNLDVSQNQLTSILELSHFIVLGDVNFNNNRISDSNSGSLPSGVFRLGLKFNSFPFIPRALLNITTGASMDLPWNSITIIRATDFPQPSLSINLADNLITELADDSFPPNSSILYLNLNYNPLSVISSLAFVNLPNLYELDVQQTQLNRLPLAMTSLTKLRWFDITGVPDLVCTCSEKSLEVVFKHVYILEGSCGQISVHDFFTFLSSGCPAT